MNFGNCCICARKAHASIRKFSKENLTVKVSDVIADAHLIPMKFRTVYCDRRENVAGQWDTYRRIMEIGQPFESSSTVVHPCTSQPMYVLSTSVEDKFCSKTCCCLIPRPPWAHWWRVLRTHKTSLYWQEVSGSKQYRVFHQENSKLKNVQGCTFFSDAILVRSDWRVFIILWAVKISLLRIPWSECWTAQALIGILF